MSGPPGMLGRMLRSGSWLASVFPTPAGWAWLEWACYNLSVYLHEYSKVRDDEPIPPAACPGSHPTLGFRACRAAYVVQLWYHLTDGS